MNLLETLRIRIKNKLGLVGFFLVLGGLAFPCYSHRILGTRREEVVHEFHYQGQLAQVIWHDVIGGYDRGSVVFENGEVFRGGVGIDDLGSFRFVSDEKDTITIIWPGDFYLNGRKL